MTPLAVVEDFDVLLDRQLCVSSGGITVVVDQLILQTFPETLHRGVVVAVSLT